MTGAKMNKNAVYARCNKKLDYLDLTVDIANIGHFSRRAYQTGFVPAKTIKKWRKRGERHLQSGYCSGQHAWLPATVIKETKELGLKKSFWWRCRKCGCITKWVWEDELSEPMLNAYREQTHAR